MSETARCFPMVHFTYQCAKSALASNTSYLRTFAQNKCLVLSTTLFFINKTQTDFYLAASWYADILRVKFFVTHSSLSKLSNLRACTNTIKTCFVIVILSNFKQKFLSQSNNCRKECRLCFLVKPTLFYNVGTMSA